MAEKSVFVKLLHTVEEVDRELEELAKWVEEAASKILSIADEEARRIKVLGESLAEEAVKRINRVYEEEAARLEKEFEERIRRELEKVEELAEMNRDRAVEEAAKTLLKVMTGGRA